MARGLKDTSIKTRIETPYSFGFGFVGKSLKDTSIKTRIETQLILPLPAYDRRRLKDTSIKTRIETRALQNSVHMIVSQSERYFH
mgnify:CR=1 FL=1